VADERKAEPAGYVPRDPGALRYRIIEALDNILDHPLIVGRDGLDLARALKRYFESAPEQVLRDIADKA
jgi:hypothetical protein